MKLGFFVTVYMFVYYTVMYLYHRVHILWTSYVTSGICWVIFEECGNVLATSCGWGRNVEHCRNADITQAPATRLEISYRWGMISFTALYPWRFPPFLYIPHWISLSNVAALCYFSGWYCICLNSLHYPYMQSAICLYEVVCHILKRRLLPTTWSLRLAYLQPANYFYKVCYLLKCRLLSDYMPLLIAYFQAAIGSNEVCY